MTICYLGPLRDYSGYGEANRHAVAALDAAHIEVVAKLVSYASESADFGTMGQVVSRLLENHGDYRIKILHTTPNEYRKYMEEGKYHIGHFFWETDRVPEEFAESLKLMDEIWTGSEANKQAIINAGVDKPVYIFPQAIETERTWPEPYVLPEFEGYLFYSIFEWTDRKNPQALLNAYWNEFQHGEKVGLLIKSYFRNFSLQSKRMIRNEIRSLKLKSGLHDFPPVFLYTELMDRQQVERLHMTGDCFVSAHRGEGWGVPQVEAMLAGKPIISTNYGGVHEYLGDKHNALLPPAEMIPVKGMTHSPVWYASNQNWADVDPRSLRNALRFAYENKKEMDKIAQRGQDFVKENLNLKNVGKAMALRLKQIEESL